MTTPDDRSPRSGVDRVGVVHHRPARVRPQRGQGLPPAAVRQTSRRSSGREAALRRELDELKAPPGRSGRARRGHRGGAGSARRRPASSPRPARPPRRCGQGPGPGRPAPRRGRRRGRPTCAGGPRRGRAPARRGRRRGRPGAGRSRWPRPRPRSRPPARRGGAWSARPGPSASGCWPTSPVAVTAPAPSCGAAGRA